MRAGLGSQTGSGWSPRFTLLLLVRSCLRTGGIDDILEDQVEPEVGKLLDLRKRGDEVKVLDSWVLGRVVWGPRLERTNRELGSLTSAF